MKKNDNKIKFAEICKALNVTPCPQYADNCFRGKFTYEGNDIVVSWQNSKKFEFFVCQPRPKNKNMSTHSLDSNWNDLKRTINEGSSKPVEVIAAGFKRRFDWEAFKSYRDSLTGLELQHEDKLNEHNALIDRMSKITGFPIFGKYDHNTETSLIDRTSASHELRTPYYGEIKLQHNSASFELRCDDPKTIDLICEFIRDNQSNLK